MRVLLVTFGSDGDTRPMVALARGLAEAGHGVRLLADPSGARLAEGLDFAALPGSLRDAMEDASGRIAASMRRGRARMSDFAAVARSQTGGWLARIDAAAADADVIVGSSVAVYHALSVGETRGIVRIAAGFQPYLPTSEWASVFTGLVRTPRWVNRPLTEAVNHLIWRSMRGPLNAARAGLGQPPVRRDWTEYPALGAWSPTLVPTPADWLTGRNGHRLTVTGDWHLSEGPFTPDAALAAFLDAGEPPLYVGFGSMTGFGREAELVEALLAGADGRRVLLSSGWAGLGAGDLPASVHVIGRVPHDWLFPRCAAVVHHCGAGTSHAAARAGVGTVGVPIVADQPFWADRLLRLGIASEPLNRHRLDPARVRAAISQATSPDVRGRALEVAARMASEDGVRAAALAIERRYRER